MSINLRDVVEQWFMLALDDLDVIVYRHPAPEKATYPCVTVGMRTAVDLSPIGTGNSCEKITYDVSAWDKGLSSVDVNELATQINDALLTSFPITVDGGTIVACRRIGATITPQIIEQGQTFQRDGAIFEVLVSDN
jgi:hypothetical protein